MSAIVHEGMRMQVECTHEALSADLQDEAQVSGDGVGCHQ